ncbi:antitoxin component of RelBE/YafQ-DinJ toxin-antitoxin module [Paraburkholderia sp. EB58]|jgi:antitoxin component of RelBE/YafQ-DinJ toxin-antitoxin module|uniref:hypothetical protein n=1 Tax=Paraburkholderia sp. EB58 TaxID=3035125 RepID=UPI003D230D40
MAKTKSKALTEYVTSITEGSAAGGKRTFVGASVSPELHAAFVKSIFRIGIGASPLIRLFMEHVVAHGEVPFKIPERFIHPANREAYAAKLKGEEK